MEGFLEIFKGFVEIVAECIDVVGVVADDELVSFFPDFDFEFDWFHEY